ncbi:thymidine phosphorylase [Nocardiopsis baichengensis]|uniref:thymidine phosphorylase n=1 Tax=Nocardiopsis baichengensis TaxID=280240 RepID=UPI00034A41D4|nr:thymidine phosphorylase [Nocardiopsis baichengensis]
MDAIDIITAKRDGAELTREQIEWLIAGYADGSGISDEQMAALCMAVVWRGMTRAEVAFWTEAVLASGERLDLSGLDRPTTDKHSTGGVGDKTTLPLTPAVVACGAAVPQLSGRGLGHTGGTLDKLESIPGWRADLGPEELRGQLREVGGAVCAAGPGLAPADRRLYALRDVTGTVESIPLIAASIMSKKLAEGTGALVLDVKVGAGAFMKDVESARELARTMVGIGNDNKVRTRALLTAMDVPLGRAVGNALEVEEALEVLSGGGPEDVVRLTVELGREMLDAAGLGGAKDPADALRDGTAMDAWRAMVRAQGGDPDAALPQANERGEVLAPASGVLASVDAHAVGVAAWRLGAGRARKEDRVSPGAGVVLHAGPGERVRAGRPLFTLHTDDPSRFRGAAEVLTGAARLEPAGEKRLPLIIDRVGESLG